MDIFARITAVALIFLLASSVSAQSGGPVSQQGISATPQLYAIRNARIVTVTGPEIDNGTVILRDGKIEAVGPSVPIPAGAKEIDAAGLTVYPGMIDAGTSLGLVEVGSGAPGGVDVAEIGEMNPNVRAIVAVNPHSAHFGVTRVNGITSAVTLPRGGLISGQAAVINLYGTTPGEMAVVPSAALMINFPTASTTSFDFLFNPQTTSVRLNVFEFAASASNSKK